MNKLKLFFTTFFIVLIAELGDKTQIASFSLACERGQVLPVIIGSSLALITTSLLAVLAGQLLNRLILKKYLKFISGLIFIASGLFLLVTKICELGR